MLMVPGVKQVIGAEKSSPIVLIGRLDAAFTMATFRGSTVGRSQADLREAFS